MDTGSVSPTNGSACGKNRSWHILVVTDSLIDRKLASGLLTKQGHQVLFSDGLQASQACANGPLDIVIVDLFARELNAGDLVHAVRELDATSGNKCAILAVTADAHDIENQYQELGMDGFLVKPLNTDQINMWMERCARQQQASAPSDRIDWSDALELVDGKRELLQELVDIFFEEYPPTLAAIRDAIDQQNIKQLQLSAHKLKGCLRYFGRSTASEKAQELEHMARNGTMSGAAGRLLELETAMSVLVPLLKSAPR